MRNDIRKEFDSLKVLIIFIKATTAHTNKEGTSEVILTSLK